MDKEAAIREAGIRDVWNNWVRVPFNSLLRNAPKFKNQAVDDVFDDIVRDIAPIMMVEVQKELVQKHFDAFEGALKMGAYEATQGKRPYVTKHKLMFPKYRIRKGQDIDWESEGYVLGYQSPSYWTDPKTRKDAFDIVIRAILKQESDDVVENLIKTKLYNVWMSINPVELVKTTIKMVKQHGWKVGAALALVQIIETAVIPAVVTSLGFPQYALVASQLPITEITIPIMAKYLKIEVSEPTDTEDLDDYLSRNTTRFATQFPFEEQLMLSAAMTKALSTVKDRVNVNQNRMMNLMSRVEFDRYRHGELVQLGEDIMKAPDRASLIVLLNKHTDILIELAEVSREAKRTFQRLRVKPQRR